MLHSRTATLLANRDLGHGNFLAVLDAPEIAAATLPAHFVMLRVRDGSDPLLGRPFSVARIGRGPSGPTVDILYKVMGRATTVLAGLAPGATVGLVGPLGRPFPAPGPDAGPLFMVAGGIGIAPFPLLAGWLASRGSSAHLIYGARTAAELAGLDLFAAAGVTVDTATDDGSAGHHGLVTELLGERLAALPAEDRVRALAYVCGPTPMMAATEKVLAEHGAGGHFSVETVMGCGFGVCLSCVIPVRGAGGEEAGYARVCVDGPTFPSRRVAWDQWTFH